MTSSSLAAPSPTAGEFCRLVDQIAVGTPLDEAVTELAARTGLAEYLAGEQFPFEPFETLADVAAALS